MTNTTERSARQKAMYDCLSTLSKTGEHLDADLQAAIKEGDYGFVEFVLAIGAKLREIGLESARSVENAMNEGRVAARSERANALAAYQAAKAEDETAQSAVPNQYKDQQARELQLEAEIARKQALLKQQESARDAADKQLAESKQSFRDAVNCITSPEVQQLLLASQADIEEQVPLGAGGVGG